MDNETVTAAQQKLKYIEGEIEDFLDRYEYFAKDQWGDWIADWISFLIIPAQEIAKNYSELPDDLQSRVRVAFLQLTDLRPKIEEVGFKFPKIDQVELNRVSG